MRACRHLREVNITKWLLPGKTHIEACRETLLFFLIVSVCAWMCAPAFMCVDCACVSLYKHSPPINSWLVDGCWLSHLPEFVPCQMRWGHGESTKTLINLNYCPAFCWSLPVVSNIYLVAAADTGKSAYAHRKQVAKPTGLCCRPARGSDKYRIFLKTVPPTVVQLSFTLIDHGHGHHHHHHH